MLSAGDIGCWLLKTSVPPAELAPGWAAGQERTLRRCLRPSYRLHLMAPGQPCVLWLSGPRDPGVHAVGHLVSAPVDGGGPGEQPAVDVALRLLSQVVPRRALLDCPALAGAEVLRMPAGSNPSYLSPAEWGALGSWWTPDPAPPAPPPPHCRRPGA